MARDEEMGIEEIKQDALDLELEKYIGTLLIPSGDDHTPLVALVALVKGERRGFPATYRIGGNTRHPREEIPQG